MHTGTFITCTMAELSLSADNVMIWAVILQRLQVPKGKRHLVLAIGIVAALLLRIPAIALGAELLERLHWLTYVLGASLLAIGYKLLDNGADSDTGIIAKLQRFIGSPTIVAALALSLTDVMFAVDSIPASFGITDDVPTIAAANIVALVAMWAMFPGVTVLIDRLPLLHYGLAAVMVWLGLGMLLSDVLRIPDSVNLSVIAALIALSGIAGIRIRRTVETNATVSEQIAAATRGVAFIHTID